MMYCDTIISLLLKTDEYSLKDKRQKITIERSPIKQSDWSVREHTETNQDALSAFLSYRSCDFHRILQDFCGRLCKYSYLNPSENHYHYVGNFRKYTSRTVRTCQDPRPSTTSSIYGVNLDKLTEHQQKVSTCSSSPLEYHVC